MSRVFETGGYRLRLPRPHGAACEAVIVNTGGGMAGGDAARFVFRCAEGASATLTTTAAEKLYRAEAAPTRVDLRLEVAGGATLEWLPQETILFDGARLARRCEVELAADATLLLAETFVFGRLAMGEVMRSGSVRDRWRVRRAGTLVFAEEMMIADDVAAALDRPALGGGARASATVLVVGADAGQRLEAVRDALATDAVTGGASAWNDMLLARALSPSPERLRGAIVAVLAALRGRALPRVWQS